MSLIVKQLFRVFGIGCNGILISAAFYRGNLCLGMVHQQLRSSRASVMEGGISAPFMPQVLDGVVPMVNSRVTVSRCSTSGMR